MKKLVIVLSILAVSGSIIYNSNDLIKNKVQNDTKNIKNKFSFSYHDHANSNIKDINYNLTINNNNNIYDSIIY